MSNTTKRATEAYWDPGLFEVGLGYVLVARFRAGGIAELGVFLLDVLCLGVKDAFFSQITEYEYDHRFRQRLFGAGKGGVGEPLEPACARALVEETVAYAARLGIGPHADFKAACRVLGGIKADAGGRVFTFGKDGKPCFVPRPHDTPERCRLILGLLNSHCGEDNFTFLIPDTLFRRIYPTDR